MCEDAFFKREFGDAKYYFGLEQICCARMRIQCISLDPLCFLVNERKMSLPAGQINFTENFRKIIAERIKAEHYLLGR